MLKCSRNNRSKYLMAALVWIAGHAFAYESNYGPFPDNANVERIKIVELAAEPETSCFRSSDVECIFRAPHPCGAQVVVTQKKETRFVGIVVDGRIAMPPTEFSDVMFGAGLKACSADLNQDRIPDFMVYARSGGCGFSCGYCGLAIILSSGGKYVCTTVLSLLPNDSDFILLDGKPYFIHTSFFGVDKCNDGRHHNFWIYNLMAIGQDEIRLDNRAHKAFPKTVWYTYAPNHAETSIISDSQKAELWKKTWINLR